VSWAGLQPQGTVIWSNPVASGASSLLPAVPSPAGVADVFALVPGSTNKVYAPHQRGVLYIQTQRLVILQHAWLAT
jgi:hypothetical protein